MNNYDTVFQDEKYNLKDQERIDFVYDWVKQKGYKELVDLGCGRGHYLKYLLKQGLKMTGVEPSHYVIAHDLKGLPATEASILTYDKHHEAFYCMDVLEHIPPHEINETLRHMATIAPHGLVGIANHPDSWGNQELHLIQENVDWWHDKLAEHFTEVTELFREQRYYIFEVHRV